MKKRAVVAILVGLILTFSACSKDTKDAEPSSTPDPQVEVSVSDDAEVSEEETGDDLSQEVVKIDSEKIKTSDQIVHGFELRDAEETKAGYIKESYTIAESQSYEDKWYREYEVLYPEFTDEITAEGADTIKEYYATKAEDEKAKMASYFEEFGFKDEVWDSAAELQHYYFQNYAVSNPMDNYMAVKYNAFSFFGGAHGSQDIRVDNFDLKTGKVLTLEDLFGDVEVYAPVLNEKLNAGIKEKGGDQEIDVANMGQADDTQDELVYELTDKGVNFIFNQYVVGPYSLGIVEVEIPYADLADILQISVNA